jgi:hypothetical protein
MGIRTLNTQGHDHQPRVKVPGPSGPSQARGLQRVNDVREIRHDLDINITRTLEGDNTWGIINRKEEWGGNGGKACGGRIYVQQLGACTAAGWLTLIESCAAEEGALAASACESIRRALMLLDETE